MSNSLVDLLILKTNLDLWLMQWAIFAIILQTNLHQLKDFHECN